MPSLCFPASALRCKFPGASMFSPQHLIRLGVFCSFLFGGGGGRMGALFLRHSHVIVTARSFTELAHVAYGKKGVIATQLALIIATFGTSTSYLVIAGDMLSPLIGTAERED